MGFGRSDKPTDVHGYTIARHVEIMTSLITALDLRRVTLVCQDWGGPIGLAQAVSMPERFDRRCGVVRQSGQFAALRGEVALCVDESQALSIGLARLDAPKANALGVRERAGGRARVVAHVVARLECRLGLHSTIPPGRFDVTLVLGCAENPA